MVSPADGRISQIGRIRGKRLWQAKGHEFELLALLAGDKEKAAAFHDGLFATVYLSPRDYHRVHLPFAGASNRWCSCPASCSVSATRPPSSYLGCSHATRRVICHFVTDFGPMAVILVGAISSAV